MRERSICCVTRRMIFHAFRGNGAKKKKTVNVASRPVGRPSTRRGKRGSTTAGRDGGKRDRTITASRFSHVIYPNGLHTHLRSIFSSGDMFFTYVLLAGGGGGVADDDDDDPTTFSSCRRST